MEKDHAFGTTQKRLFDYSYMRCDDCGKKLLDGEELYECEGCPYEFCKSCKYDHPVHSNEW